MMLNRMLRGERKEQARGASDTRPVLKSHDECNKNNDGENKQLGEKKERENHPENYKMVTRAHRASVCFYPCHHHAAYFASSFLQP